MNLRFQPAGWIPQRTQLGCWRVGGWGEAWRRRPQYQRQEWGIGRGPRGSWAQNWGGLNMTQHRKEVRISHAPKKGRIWFFEKSRWFEDQGTKCFESEPGTTGIRRIGWWYGSNLCVDGSHGHLPRKFTNHFLVFSLQLFIAFPLIQCWKANNMFHRHVSKYQHSSINIYQHYLFPFINIYQPLSTFINIHPPFSKTTLIMEVS